jgi:hypothetical protein
MKEKSNAIGVLSILFFEKQCAISFFTCNKGQSCKCCDLHYMGDEQLVKKPGELL